jgi:hypothetical protein
MRREPITVSPDTRVSDLIENYLPGRNLKLVKVSLDEPRRLLHGQ